MRLSDCLVGFMEKIFQFDRVDKSKISVLNNIVPPPNFRDSPRKDNKLHLMFMGEISMRKGGFDLLQAISDNKEYFKDKLLLRMGGNEVDGDIKTS